MRWRVRRMVIVYLELVVVHIIMKRKKKLIVVKMGFDEF